MKKLGCLIIGFSILVCGAGAAFGESEVDFEVTADFFSKYIWRGQNLNDDPVFQTGLNVGYRSLTATIWGNIDLTNYNGNSGDFSEVDYCLDYSSKVPGIKGVGYSIGAAYYSFPSTNLKDTTELYWGLNFDLPLNPSMTVYHDVDEADGTYLSFALGHSVEKIIELTSDIPIGMEIDASLGWASASYNNYYWGADQSKLNDLAFSVSFPIEIGGLTLAPSLNYVTLLSDDIRATDTYGTDSDFFFSPVSVSRRGFRKTLLWLKQKTPFFKAKLLAVTI